MRFKKKLFPLLAFQRKLFFHVQKKHLAQKTVITFLGHFSGSVIIWSKLKVTTSFLSITLLLLFHTLFKYYILFYFILDVYFLKRNYKYQKY